MDCAGPPASLRRARRAARGNRPRRRARACAAGRRGCGSSAGPDPRRPWPREMHRGRSPRVRASRRRRSRSRRAASSAMKASCSTAIAAATRPAAARDSAAGGGRRGANSPCRSSMRDGRGSPRARSSQRAPASKGTPVSRAPAREVGQVARRLPVHAHRGGLRAARGGLVEREAKRERQCARRVVIEGRGHAVVVHQHARVARTRRRATSPCAARRALSGHACATARPARRSASEHRPQPLAIDHRDQRSRPRRCARPATAWMCAGSASRRSSTAKGRSSRIVDGAHARKLRGARRARARRAAPPRAASARGISSSDESFPRAARRRGRRRASTRSAWLRRGARSREGRCAASCSVDAAGATRPCTVPWSAHEERVGGELHVVLRHAHAHREIGALHVDGPRRIG